MKFKNILNYEGIWAVGFFLIAGMFFINVAFDRPATQTYVFEDENGAVETYDFMPPKSYQKVWAADTITNTEKDTLLIPWIMASPYQYSYQFKVTKLTGFNNNNFKVVLDQANTTSSTMWMAIDSFTRSGADSTRRDWLIKGGDTWGARHRLRVIGASVNLTQYYVTANIKPPNQ